VKDLGYILEMGQALKTPFSLARWPRKSFKSPAAWVGKRRRFGGGEGGGNDGWTEPKIDEGAGLQAAYR